MPLRTAFTLTFAASFCTPLGSLAVAGMTPMAALALRFGLGSAILAAWTQLSGVRWPTGRRLGHVLVAGLLMQAVPACCLFEAVEHGAPAVLCAVVIAMTPLPTALLTKVFLRERLGPWRIAAVVLGLAAVLAACAHRLTATHGVDPAIVLLLFVVVGLSVGGIYQQWLCADVDFRASTTLQNAVALVPTAVLASMSPFVVHDAVKAAIAVAGLVLWATFGSCLNVRAINAHGASAVAMLSAVIPAIAGLLSWLMLGQRPDIGIAIGLALGAAACLLNSRACGKPGYQPPSAAQSRGGLQREPVSSVLAVADGSAS